MSDHRLLDLLNLSNVPRWSVRPRYAEQSVADHSFRTAVIVMELLHALNLPPNGLALVYALEHDAAESETADISGLFKDRMGSELRLQLDIAGRKLVPWFDPTSYSSKVRHLVKTAELKIGRAHV